MSELRDREVIRSGNNPVGDICEGLVSAHFRVKPESNSKAGYDVLTERGVRIQVKGRRTTPLSRPSHYSAVRGLPDKPFDLLVAVLDEDFQLTECWPSRGKSSTSCRSTALTSTDGACPTSAGRSPSIH
jgi:Family of unknown function (DUF6998)